MTASMITRSLASAALTAVVLMNGCGGSSPPLSAAAQTNNVEWAKALIDEQKVDVNAKDSSGFSALSWAAFDDAPLVANLLLERGAQVDSVDTAKNTPLLIATTRGYTDVVNVLVAHHANVNVKDASQWTPLMYAAKAGSLDIVKALVGAGADVNYVEITRGDNAMALARSYGHDDILYFLSGKDQGKTPSGLPTGTETAKIQPAPRYPGGGGKPPSDDTLTPKKINAVPTE